MRPCSVLFSCLLIVAFNVTAASPTIVRPPNDGRDYDVLTLSNHLRVVLVSDSKADKAAASLVVHAGSLDDPAAFPGLAHFLEHMLFLGTRKYPDAGAYKAFVSAHGGHDNAYTAAEYTNYHFDIAPDALVGALDRFAQFFIAPSFDAAYIGRERHAVDAEYRLKIRDDGRRLQQVVRETVNPAHPYARFAVGNLETLADHDGKSLRQALLDFYEHHYSANLMTLAVLGREPLPELRRIVRERFTAVPDRGIKAVPSAAPLFDPRQRPRWVDVKPVRQLRELRIDFSYGWQAVDQLAKPTLLIGHLLGHEGEGSLLAELKKRGWANALSAGGGQRLGREARFSVTIDLTESGLEHRNEIVALVFATLHLIDEQGTADRIIAELRTINDIDFRFREKGRALSETITLASNLQRYPAAEVLHGPYVISGPTATRVHELLAEFVPDKAVVFFMAPGVETDRVARWYATPYRSRPITDEQLAAWRQASLPKAVHLPGPNAFIPERLELKPVARSADHPLRIATAPGYELWHQQDISFGVPRAQCFVSLIGSPAMTGRRQSVLLRLYAELVDDALDTYAYSARLAGLHYHVMPTMGGIAVEVGGFDDKIDRLLQRIIGTVLGLDVDDRRFAVIRERLLRQWMNRQQDRPYQQAGRDLVTLLKHRAWSIEGRLAELATITADEFRRFTVRFESELWMRMLVHGNLTPAEAMAMGSRLLRHVREHARNGHAPVRHVVRLGAGHEYVFRRKLEHDDSAVAVYFQAPADTIADQARFALFNQLVRTPFFNRLRTEAQLGYVVYASPVSIYRVPGEAFFIQSPRLAADGLVSRIDDFLRGFVDDLAAMGAAEYDQQRQALVGQLAEKETRLGQRSQRYAHDLRLGYLGFDHRQRLIEEVAHLSRDDLLTYVRALVDPHQGRRLLAEALGSRDRAAIALRPGRILIDDIPLFRRSLPSFVLPEGTRPGSPSTASGPHPDS